MTHPLAGIIETKTYPHARTLRTSFSQKLWDTFTAMIVGENHVGIFDYITLFIPLGLLFLLAWCFENKKSNFFATALFIPVILINIPFVTVRVVFSAAASIIFSPIIAIVHGISRLVAGQSHTEALGLVGQLSNGEEQTLDAYLTHAHMDIEELNITIKKSIEESESISEGGEVSSSSYQLMFWEKTKDSSGLMFEDFTDKPAPFSIEIMQEEGNSTVKQATNIHALFRLNVGDVVRNIEKANINSSDKGNILAI